MTEDVKAKIWIQNLCAGEEEAYKIFFDEYYQIFAHFAMRYVNDPEICKDIIHDVILDLYSTRRIFPEINSLKSFLFRSIKNRCLNHLEHKKAEGKYIQEKNTEQNDDFFLNAIIQEEVYFLMHKTIHELPARLRKIYELSLSGRTNEEIANELSLSLDSVKAYKKRGKQILKEKLKNLFFILSVHI